MSSKLRLPHVGQPDDLQAASRRVLTSAGLVGRLPTVLERALTPAPSEAEPPGGADAAIRFGALIEAAFLVAAADGYLSSREVDALADCLEGAGVEVDDEVLEGFIDQLADELEEEGVQGRITAIAGALDHAGQREALAFAALVGLSNGQLGVPEADRLLALGHAFGLDAQGVQEVIDRVASSLKSPA